MSYSKTNIISAPVNINSRGNFFKEDIMEKNFEEVAIDLFKKQKKSLKKLEKLKQEISNTLLMQRKTIYDIHENNFCIPTEETWEDIFKYKDSPSGPFIKFNVPKNIKDFPKIKYHEVYYEHGEEQYWEIYVTKLANLDDFKAFVKEFWEAGWTLQLDATYTFMTNPPIAFLSFLGALAYYPKISDDSEKSKEIWETLYNKSWCTSVVEGVKGYANITRYETENTMNQLRSVFAGLD